MQRRFVRARLLKSEPCTPQFAAAMIKRMLKENASLSHTDVSNLERAATALAELDGLNKIATAGGDPAARQTPAKPPLTEGPAQAAAAQGTPEAKPMRERTTDASAKKAKSSSRKKRKSGDGEDVEAAATPAAAAKAEKAGKDARSTEKKHKKKKDKGSGSDRKPS